MQPIVCDQAVFTCIRSALGQGYRIIAQSAGLRPAETAEIAKRSPSGEGFCDDGPDATGVSFFPLPGGRYAAVFSQCSGLEPTGRGGRRAYTRALVTDAQGLARFQNNAFDMLRAAAGAGLLADDINAEKPLPKAELTGELTPCVESIDATIRDIGSSRLCGIVEQLLAGEKIVANAACDLNALTEAVVLCLPAPRRPAVSFVSGLRACVTRENSFSAVRDDVARLRDILRGRPAHVDDLTDALDLRLTSGWARAMDRMFSVGRGHEAIDLASRRFTSLDAEAIDRIGLAFCAAFDIRSQSAIEVLRTTAAHLPPAHATPLESQLSEELSEAARGRLAAVLPDADAATIREVWEALDVMPVDRPHAAGIIDKVVYLAMSYMGRLDLPAALGMALAPPAPFGKTGCSMTFSVARRDVLARVVDRASLATPDELAALADLLLQWQKTFPDEEMITEAGRAVHARLSQVTAAAP